MRLTDGYRCTDSIKERNYLVPRKHRIEKIRDEELGEELEEAMYKKNRTVFTTYKTAWGVSYKKTI